MAQLGSPLRGPVGGAFVVGADVSTQTESSPPPFVGDMIEGVAVWLGSLPKPASFSVFRIAETEKGVGLAS